MILAQYTNSENEKITIEQRTLRHKPVLCLVIHDDPPPLGSGRPAPMLLDKGLHGWLLEQLTDNLKYL